MTRERERERERERKSHLPNPEGSVTSSWQVSIAPRKN